MTDIQTVGVIGAGTMGNGIAHVFARSGYRVLLCEVERRFLDRGLETIRKNLAREAATEKFDIKKALFQELDNIAKPGVILASNTSSISITKLAAVTARPDRVIGMHFFNPVPVMKLVEVIRGLQTSQETYETV